MQYEINYLVLQSKTAQIDQIRQEIKQLIETENGKITGERNYLKRKLAYEISHENYGFYTVLRFEMEDTENVAKLKRELNLSGNVSRYIIVKTDTLPPLEQAPTMKEETAAETTPEGEKSKVVLEEIMKEPKPAPTPKEEVKTETPKVEEEKSQVAEEKPAEEKPAEEKKPEVKDEKEEKKEEKKDKSKEDDKASLDELDKKLDEILNI